MATVVSNPRVTLNIIRSAEPSGLTEQKVLFVGQLLAAGTATPGALVESVGSGADVDALFGRRSHLAYLVRQARRINSETQFDAIPLSDAGGATQAAGTITFTGTATASGSLVFEVVSSRFHSYVVDVVSGDTAAAVATDLAALITADLDAPFTAADLAGVVTITAANGGTLANGWPLRVSGSVSGLTVALAAFSGGATDPSLTGIFSQIDSVRYQTIVWPNRYSATAIKDLVNARFNATNEVLDGVAILSRTDTLANLETLAGTTFNSQGVVLIGNKNVATATHLGSCLREWDDGVAAQFAGARALRRTDGANLGRIVTATAPKDQFGSLSLSTLPYHNTPFEFINPPIVGTFWTSLERSDLEDSGVSVLGANRARNGVVADQIYTTSITDLAGNPDTSFKFLETVDAVSAVREYYWNNFKRRFVQSRLTLGEVLSGRAMENEQTIRSYCLTLYRDLAEAAITQSGSAAERFYAQSLVVEVTLTSATGLVFVSMAPPLVGQLRDIQGTVRVNFSVELEA